MERVWGEFGDIVERSRRECVKRVGILYRECIESIERLWVYCGDSVEKLWI